jgi:deoxyribonuclease-4
MPIHFGPAGNSESFYAAGYKASVQMPGYLQQLGLNAYEYQCGKGVRVSDSLAASLKQKSQEHGITLSLHAPYYINFANPEEEKQKNTIDYVLQSCEAAKKMGASRVVAHTGALMKMTREEALGHAKKLLRRTLDAVDACGLGDIHVCPETMGKINQLGDLNEVLELCQLDDRLLPTIDFGHLNARTLGGLTKKEEMAAVLDAIEDKLGHDRLKVFHSHFSKIAYTKGGKKCHLTFEDMEYGPEFFPLAELIYERGLEPTFICESAGTQTEDALAMKEMYERMKNK